MPASSAATYLLVLPVPCHDLGGGRFAVESAFAMHLRQQLLSFGDHVDQLLLAAPWIDSNAYAQVRDGWAELDLASDRIGFVPMFPASAGCGRFLLELPSLFGRLVRLAGTAKVVHGGPSALVYRPYEILGVLAGLLWRKPTIYVIDIDYRQSARMQLATGALTYGAYWRKRYMHNSWMGLQTWLSARLVDVVMLKGQKLVADYGHSLPNVHYILDVAHNADQVLPEEAVATRVATLRGRPAGSLRAVYFGRLVAYKGVDRMIDAIQAARARGIDATLDVFGGGPEEAALLDRVAAVGAAHWVRFHGARPYGDEFLAEVGDFDVLLACPLSEDTPRSAIDAQARALPVLAFDTYYYRELAEQGAGVACVPWGDTPALAASIATFANERGLLAELAEAGRRFAAVNTQDVWLARRAKWTFGRAADNR